jgi:putative hydrolase of the HAD superfamily
MSSRRAVLLDALGTLLALEDPAPALVRGLSARGLVVSVEDARSALRAEMTFYRAHHDQGSSPEGLAALRRRCAEVLRDGLPQAARGISVEEALAVLMASLRFTPYPEVGGTLAALRGAGSRLVVVSNWDLSLHEVLDTTGLAELLDGAVTSAEVGFSKPRPEVFARALELAGVSAHDALHVGDSVEHDVVGARAAGIEPVLVLRPRPDRPAVPDGGENAQPTDRGVTVIASLAELPPLVAT